MTDRRDAIVRQARVVGAGRSPCPDRRRAALPPGATWSLLTTGTILEGVVYQPLTESRASANDRLTRRPTKNET